MYSRISSLIVLLLPAIAMAEGGGRADCLHQPESCLIEKFGQPSERIPMTTIMQYDELRQRVGKYADTAPSAIAMNKGYALDKEGGAPLSNQETLVFKNPRITPSNGTPFTWACTFHATLLDGKVNGSGIQCPQACNSQKFVHQIIAEALSGNVDDSCKL